MNTDRIVLIVRLKLSETFPGVNHFWGNLQRLGWS